MAHWRDTYKPARFFFLDAKAGVPVIACLVHIKVYTVAPVVVWILLFWFLERRGTNFTSAFRGLRAWMIGDVRPGRNAFTVRGRIDYERRD